MERGGLGVVRRDAAWEVVEPRPSARPGRHVYRWQATDRMVRALASHGLRWYPIVNYSAAWAASRRAEVFSPPASDDDYVAFARARSPPATVATAASGGGNRQTARTR